MRITGQLLSEQGDNIDEVSLHLNYQTGKKAYKGTEMAELDL